MENGDLNNKITQALAKHWSNVLVILLLAVLSYIGNNMTGEIKANRLELNTIAQKMSSAEQAIKGLMDRQMENMTAKDPLYAAMLLNKERIMDNSNRMFDIQKQLADLSRQVYKNLDKNFQRSK
jgi:hypothetical protein